MKKVIIPFFVLVAAGAGWYFIKGNKTSKSINLGASLKEEAFKGSMAAAVKLGVPMKCSYSIGDEMESEGYIKGKNYRGKAVMEQGKISEVIMKDECMWNWDADSKEGTKFCFEGDQVNTMWEDFDENVEEMDEPQEFKAPDVEFDCNPVVVSDDMFAPPTDVSFVDMAAMMQESVQKLEESMDDFEIPEGMDSVNLDDFKGL
ncbi:hypothetical protein ACFL1M_04355 [Patescibacteria group bacterium]